ncbi:MAG: hydroxymethylbilane synthase [Flavobacteriales bacterium]|nr:hydroxymethylbilane synthase [Flavobacteriales bacterium]
MTKKIIIGSRGSELALWQANHVTDQLKALGLESEIKVIKTQGDIIQHLSFDKMEGKGFFTKEIEEALLNKSIDLAVHSHKDLETTSPEGLQVAAVSPRVDPAELLIIRKGSADITQKFSLRKRAVVGTSSARRKTQLLSFRKDVSIRDLRGNVPTRINKLREGEYDAIMLAAAGVDRLEISLDEFHVERLNPKEFIPAPAQGVLGLQIREEDTELFEALQPINDAGVQAKIAIERGVLKMMHGGCQLPLGVYCEKENGVFKTWAVMSRKWKDFPKRVYMETKTSKEGTEKIHRALNETNALSVFITRDLDLEGYLANSMAANGINLKGKSLIEIVRVDFYENEQTEWVFFSSSNAVNHFFDQEPSLIRSVKYGTIGTATEEALNKRGIIADFVGSSPDTAVVGKAFAEIVRGKTILFPGASQSMRSVQKELTEESKAFDLSVYETLHKQGKVEDADVFIFTSPSNIDSFFANNSIDSDKKVIAIGPSTKKKLEAHFNNAMVLPYLPSELAIVDTIFSLN